MHRIGMPSSVQLAVVRAPAVVLPNDIEKLPDHNKVCDKQRSGQQTRYAEKCTSAELSCLNTSIALACWAIQQIGSTIENPTRAAHCTSSAKGR